MTVNEPKTVREGYTQLQHENVELPQKGGGYPY